MRLISAALLGLILAGPAAADTALERLEAATELVTTKIHALYVERIPALESILPVVDWDSEYRAAGDCLVTAIRTQIDEPTLQIYLAALEEYAARPFQSLNDLTYGAHPILSNPQIGWFVHDCGTSAIARQRMIDSGFAEALTHPDVLLALRDG